MSSIAAARKLGIQWALAIAVLFLLSSPAAPVGPPVMGLYEDFSGHMLKPEKWSTPEIVRYPQSGALVSGIRMFNIPGGYWNDLAFANPENISSIQADVTMQEYMAPPGGSSRIRLKMALFNDGTAGTGDVYVDV